MPGSVPAEIGNDQLIVVIDALKLIVIFATIAVSRAAERAKQREAQRGRA